MLTYERQAEILKLLKEEKCVTVDFLCGQLFASGATIRRDLDEMSKKGLITRIRGGAICFQGSGEDAPLLLREKEEIDKKRRIAFLALEFIENSKTYFLDSSSTVTELAPHFAQHNAVSVVTNGIRTANVLNEKTAVNLYLCGGKVISHSSLVGNCANELISNFNADVCFFSCCGVTSAGTNEAKEENAILKKKMIENSKLHILLCDSTKFDKDFFWKAVSCEKIDYIITDKKPEKTFLNAVNENTKIIY